MKCVRGLRSLGVYWFVGSFVCLRTRLLRKYKSDFHEIWQKYFVSSHLRYYRTGNIAIRSADPENP